MRKRPLYPAHGHPIFFLCSSFTGWLRAGHDLAAQCVSGRQVSALLTSPPLKAVLAALDDEPAADQVSEMT